MKRKMIFGSFSNYAESHDHQVLRKKKEQTKYKDILKLLKLQRISKTLKTQNKNIFTSELLDPTVCYF